MLERTITCKDTGELADVVDALTDRGLGFSARREGGYWIVTVIEAKRS